MCVGTVPLILNLGTRWRWMVWCFTSYLDTLEKFWCFSWPFISV